MNLQINFFIAAIIAITSPITLLAQAQDASNDTLTALKEVIVTATKTSSKSLFIPYSTNVQSRAALDQYQYRTTPEALSGLTGLFIQKTNHGGGSAFLRGLTGNQTLILVDGIRFNNSTFRYGPNQYLNTVDAYSISKIEVARGTGSVQFGSDAMGGVIQVFTKEPSFNERSNWHANAMAKTFTHNMEYTGRGEVEYQSEKFAMLSGLTIREFGNLKAGGSSGFQAPSGYGETAFDIKMKWLLGNKIQLIVANQFLKQTDVPLYHRVKLENYAYYQFSPQQRNMSYAKLAIDGKSKWIRKVDFIASMQKNQEARTYQKNQNNSKFTEQDKVTSLGGTIDINSLISKSWTSNSGFEVYNDKVKSAKQQQNIITNALTQSRGLYPDNATANNLSLYTLHHIRINRLNIEAGLRWNTFQISIPDTTTSLLKLGNVKVKPSSLVSNIGLLYNLNNRQSIYTSFSTGYRAPNIDDMGTLGLVDFRYEIPAYNLKPEKSYNTELGYKLVSKKSEVSAALFYMHLQDLISRVQLAGQKVGEYNVYNKQNSTSSYIKGAELSFNYQLLKSLSLKSGLAYTYGQNISKKEPMRRIPPLNGRIITSYKRSNWQFSAEALFAAKQDRLAKGDKEDNRIGVDGTAAWTNFNFFAAYKWKNLAIRTGLQNISDKEYHTHGSGINAVGRSGWMSVHLNF